MNKKFSLRTLGLAGAVVFAIITFVIVFVLASNQFGSGGASGETLPTVVALTSIAANQPITAELLTIVGVPAAGRPADAFENIEDVVGTTTRFTISEGSPITPIVLAGAQEGSEDIHLRIGPGERIVSLELPDPALAGVIKSGDTIDIGYNSPETNSSLILQNVLVLSNSAEELSIASSDSSSAEPVLLLRLTPQDAVALKLANELGTIYVVLRTYEDDEVLDNITLEAGQIIE